MTDERHDESADQDVSWWSRPEGEVWSSPERSAAAPAAPDQPLDHPDATTEQLPWGSDPWGTPSTAAAAGNAAATTTVTQDPWAHGNQAPPWPGGWSRPDDASTDTLGGSAETRRGPRGGALLAGALAVALVAGGAGGGVGWWIADHQRGSSSTIDGVSLGSAPDRDITRPPDSVAGIAATVAKSVVQIRVRTAAGAATGSGLVIRPDGYILTNNHVVAGALGAPKVQFDSGTQTEAKVIGRSASYDLAVVKVDAKNLTPLTLGNSDDIAVGDPVIAIGSPLGLAGTVTTGIISAKNGPVTAQEQQQDASGSDASFINALQTDAAINPGNSGGPLVDLRGEVIGVNSAIATVPGALGTTGGSIGLGFAIPINQARRTAEQLIATGHATHPIIGASIDGSYSGEGARIATGPGPNGSPPLSAGGPAAKAGLRPGDIITAVDGKAVSSSSELIVAIRAHVPGDRIVLTVQRGSGDSRTIAVTLGGLSE